MTNKTKTSWFLVATILLSLGGVGCKDTNEATPDGGGGSSNAGTSGGHAGKSGGSGGKGGTGGNVIPDGGIATDGGFIINDAFVPFPDGGGGGSGGTGGSTGPCGDGQTGSFAGTPKTDTQFLNHCTDSQCEPFDNVARLPLYKKGKPLPALP